MESIYIRLVITRHIISRSRQALHQSPYLGHRLYLYTPVDRMCDVAITWPCTSRAGPMSWSSDDMVGTRWYRVCTVSMCRWVACPISYAISRILYLVYSVTYVVCRISYFVYTISYVVCRMLYIRCRIRYMPNVIYRMSYVIHKLHTCSV